MTTSTVPAEKPGEEPLDVDAPSEPDELVVGVPMDDAVEAELRRQRLRRLWAAVLVLGALICGERLYHDVHQLITGQALAIGMLFAAIPVLPLVGFFVWYGRFHPEPRFLRVYALMWGTLVATYFALHLNTWLADKIDHPGFGGIRSAVFVAPPVEELMKASVIVLIAWWRRRDFGVVAGVVYGGLVGVGFAFTENVLYYAQVYQKDRAPGQVSDALGDVAHLFVWRGVAAPFIHPMFTLLTGVGIGVALRYRQLGIRLLAPAVGLLAAVLLHMSYNAAASVSSDKALLAMYAGVLLPTAVGALVAVLLVRRRDLRVIGARVGDYAAAGWLRPEEVPYLVEPRERRLAQSYARRRGLAELYAVQQAQRAAVDVGVLRDRIVLGIASRGQIESEWFVVDRLRSRLDEAVLPVPSDPADGAEPRGVVQGDGIS